MGDERTREVGEFVAKALLAVVSVLRAKGGIARGWRTAGTVPDTRSVTASAAAPSPHLFGSLKSFVGPKPPLEVLVALLRAVPSCAGELRPADGV